MSGLEEACISFVIKPTPFFPHAHRARSFRRPGSGCLSPRERVPSLYAPLPATSKCPYESRVTICCLGARPFGSLQPFCQKSLLNTKSINPPLSLYRAPKPPRPSQPFRELDRLVRQVVEPLLELFRIDRSAGRERCDCWRQEHEQRDADEACRGGAVIMASV